MTRTVKFANYSMRREKRQGYDWYSWCVFVNEPRDVLDQILRVEYELHPTFPDPLQVRDDRESRFALFSSGWGEFEIAIRIFFADGSTHDSTHYLELGEDNWPKGDPPSELPDENAQRVYHAVTNATTPWRKVGAVARATGLPPEEVEAILGDLEKQHLVRRAQKPAMDSQVLWGATSKVGMPPWWGRTGRTPRW